MALRPRHRVALLVLVLIAGASATAWWAGDDLFQPQAMKERLGVVLAALGPWAPVVYILLYWISPFLFLPAIPLSLVGGALFGPVWGAIWGLIGSTGGACSGFIVGRAMGHDFVAKRAHGKILAVKAGIEKEGWRFVAFVRLVPLLPFGIVNLVLGTTEIRFWTYAITSMLSMAPGAFVYAYIGHAGRAAAGGAEGMTRTIGIAVGLLVLLSGIPAALRYARARKRADDVIEGAKKQAAEGIDAGPN